MSPVEEERREAIWELIANTRRTALATVHINHPGAAFKVMRQLAEYSLDVCDILQAELAGHRKNNENAS